MRVFFNLRAACFHDEAPNRNLFSRLAAGRSFRDFIQARGHPSVPQLCGFRPFEAETPESGTSPLHIK
jgi:hypothetical protein